MKNIKISKKEVEHIGRLARIKLTKKEIEKYSKELSKILDYIEKLKELDTKNIEPTAQVTGIFNVFRNDEKSEEIDSEKIKKIIGQAPQREGNFVKTGAILKNE